MSDVLGISISGLRVSQNALRTTGHNIANATTEGYSRQRTEINSLGGTASGVGYLGNGAYTANIERIVNDFVTKQVRQDTSLYNEFNAYNDHILQLNNLLANESTGLTQGFESFFAALQNAADDPTAIAARQLVISEADNLVDRFNTLYSRIDTINDSVNENLESTVNSINTLTASIARLNRSIADAFGSTDSTPPNDLLDQRDEAVRQLSELIAVNVAQQGDQYNITVGNGIPIVVGSSTSGLVLGQNEYDPLQSEIYLSTLSRPITDSLSGGQIGGLLDVQQTVIQPTFAELGRIAIAIADELNQLQQQGITLDSTFGTNLFRDVNDADIARSRVLGSTNNTTNDQGISLSIVDTSELTTSEYVVSIRAGGTYSIVRTDDNTEVSSGSWPGAFPASIEFDGLSLDIVSGTYTTGDEFLLRPTRYGASDIAVMPLQPGDIALGSPVLTDTALGNLGTAEISAGEVLSVFDASGATLPLFSQTGEFTPPLLIQFTTPTTYDILDNSNPGNPVQLDPPIRNQSYVPGIQNSLFTDDIGQTIVESAGAVLGLPATRTDLTVNEYPAETFTFNTLDPNTGAVIATQAVTSTLNASARTTAGLIDNIDGVSATAFNYIELRNFSLTDPLASPVQIALNGEDLIGYDAGAVAGDVPSPALNSGEDFNDYLAEQINNNNNLSDLGIYAVSAYDATAGEFYIQVHSTRGDDLQVQLNGAATDEIDVTDGTNAAVTLDAGTATTEVVVGGRIDISLSGDMQFVTTPATSQIFGDSTAATFAESSYWGIQANITGTPAAGDTFTIDFNENGDMDNRNGLAMVDILQAKIIDGDVETLSSSYNRLVEEVGIKTNSSEMNTNAAKKVLEQTISLRDSISGVNLDEEAADLIRFEQLYSANAQVINVARELFDRLLNSL